DTGDWCIRVNRVTYVFLIIHPSSSQFFTLSLHDALPIFIVYDVRSTLRNHFRRVCENCIHCAPRLRSHFRGSLYSLCVRKGRMRSEEHTSELQSQSNLVCRLLLVKIKTTNANGLTLHSPS